MSDWIMMNGITVNGNFLKSFNAEIAKSAEGVLRVVCGEEYLTRNNFDPDFPGTGPIKFAEE